MRLSHRGTTRPLLRFLLGAVLALAFVVPSTPAFCQQLKVGYVDLHRALNEINQGKKIKAQLKKEFAAKQAELNKKQKEVKAYKDKIEAQAMMLSDDAKRQKALKLRQKVIQLQQLYLKLQRDLSTKEAEATKDIFDKMTTIVHQIAKEKGYDLVLEKTAATVLYAKKSMDLTNELVKRYNAKY